MQQRLSVFRRILYSATGLGQVERHTAIDEILEGLSNPRLLTIKPSSVLQSQQNVRNILSFHMKTASYSEPTSQLWAVGSRKFQSFLDEERSKKTIIENLPSRTRFRSNSFRSLGLARIEEYLSDLSESWNSFQDCHSYCTAFPNLPDPERVVVMHSFAKLAKDRNWPGAEEFSGVTAFAAQLVLENLPQEGTLLPDNYGKPVLRGRPRYQPDLDWVLSDPEAAALRYLDPMIPESDTRIRPSSDFAVVASQCIDNKKITSDRPPFAVQMEALSKSVVRDLLCEIPLVERSKLNRFSQLMASNTSAIISAHEKDVLLIENLDISNKESIASAVNAMARVEQRCPFEFSRLGAVFAEHYILFATAENPSDPAEIPMKPLDIEELESLLPEVPEQRKSVPLRDYVKQLQQDMKANAYADLNFPLVRGGDRARYLIPLSHDAAYKRKARDLKERTEYRPSGFNATEFRKGKSGDNRTHFKRFSVDHWIGKRVSAFEKLRLSLLRDIQKMLDEPQFITDKRFHDTPAMMEQMRETSTEDYLHFANAFLHAIEQIPVMILEKVMPHGEVGLVIDGSSERAKEALEREMELSRRLSLSR